MALGAFTLLPAVIPFKDLPLQDFFPSPPFPKLKHNTRNNTQHNHTFFRVSQGASGSKDSFSFGLQKKALPRKNICLLGRSHLVLASHSDLTGI